MNRAAIEETLRNSINRMPIQSFEDITAMPYQTMERHDNITKQTRKQSVQTGRLTLVTVCSLLILISISGWYINYRTTDNIITIDVNPGIEIRTNTKNQILSVKAISEEARSLLKNDNYKGSELEPALRKLMEALVNYQYLKENNNTILLTIIPKNDAKVDTVLSRITATIESSLTAQNITPEIMKQVITSDYKRKQLAKRYRMSEGRMSLLQDMMNQDSSLKLDMLIGKTLQQLYDIAEAKSIDLSKYTTGNSSNASANKPNQSEDNKAVVTVPGVNSGIDTNRNQEDRENSESSNASEHHTNTEDVKNSDQGETDQVGDNEASGNPSDEQTNNNYDEDHSERDNSINKDYED